MSLVARGRRTVRRRNPGRTTTAVEKADRRVPPAPRSAPNSGSRTALQKHVDFFDTNHDGKITLADTYRGLRRLGLGTVRSATFAGVINAALGSSTSGAPSLTVDAERIHAGKHHERHGRLRQERALYLSGGSSPGTTPTATARSMGRS